MKQHQIESWVLNIVEQVKSGHPVEDSRVELKSKWIEAEKAARRIAGHANAARGAPILWIIGVNEKQRQIVGANYEELSEWFEQVISYFDGLYPDLYHINVPINDKTVAALLFDTQRAPYVVKNPAFRTKQGGPVEREVPWREGTATRTARRADLIQILSPLQALPKFESLGGFLKAVIRKEPETNLWWSMNLGIYIEPTVNETTIIPYHKCKVKFMLPNLGWVEFENILIAPSYTTDEFGGSRKIINLSKTIESTADEVIINGAGKVNLSSQAVTPLIGGSIDVEIPFTITLVPSNSEIAAVIDDSFHYDKNHVVDDFGRWSKTRSN